MYTNVLEFTKKNGKAVCTPMGGDGIQELIQKCVAARKNSDIDILIEDFNGVDVNISSSDTVETAFKRWDDEMHRQAEEWRNSPEGKAVKAEQEKKALSCQKTIDKLVKQLDHFSGKESEFVNWFGKFAKVADRVDVAYNSQEIIDRFHSWGFKTNDHIKLPKKSYDDPQVFARYIIGQCLDCMEHGMPPMPGPTERFVAEYNELVKG